MPVGGSYASLIFGGFIMCVMPVGIRICFQFQNNIFFVEAKQFAMGQIGSFRGSHRQRGEMLHASSEAPHLSNQITKQLQLLLGRGT